MIKHNLRAHRVINFGRSPLTYLNDYYMSSLSEAKEILWLRFICLLSNGPPIPNAEVQSVGLSQPPHEACHENW